MEHLDIHEAFQSLITTVDEFFAHVVNIREVLDQAKASADGNDSTSPPSYKGCLLEAVFKDLENEVSFLESLEQKKNTLRSQVISVEKRLEPSLQNRLQVQQKALKGLIRQMAKSRQENMLKLDRMHRENLVLQIDLSAHLENRGNSDRESDEDNEDEHKESRLGISQDEEHNQMWRTLEAVESTATIFTSHRPALLEKGKIIEEDLQPVSHTPTDEESKLLARARIAYEKIKTETPPSFVSMTSCLWKNYDKHTEALKCKINLEETVRKIHEAVSSYIEDAYAFEEALQDLTDYLTK
ncbi:unnamed protein product [Calicophoron daubneyi]|uniref:Uncharacterized protein n=1 Tax=Calicophoron daubneyi TaxID=300641 RepID=A0AAV2TD79_CALDB